MLGPTRACFVLQGKQLSEAIRICSLRDQATGVDPTLCCDMKIRWLYPNVSWLAEQLLNVSDADTSGRNNESWIDWGMNQPLQRLSSLSWLELVYCKYLSI